MIFNLLVAIRIIYLMKEGKSFTKDSKGTITLSHCKLYMEFKVRLLGPRISKR